MNVILEKFSRSAKELGKTKNLTVCALMLTLRIILGYFANISLSFLPNAKIGFAFLPIALAAFLCGPVAGMIVGGLGDFLSWVIMPMGGYFIGWSLSGSLAGLIYGLFLYENNNKLLFKLIICEITIGVIVEVLLGSLWLKIQFGNAFLIMTGIRSIDALISIPIETVLIFLFTKHILPKIPVLKLNKIKTTR